MVQISRCNFRTSRGALPASIRRRVEAQGRILHRLLEAAIIAVPNNSQRKEMQSQAELAGSGCPHSAREAIDDGVGRSQAAPASGTWLADRASRMGCARVGFNHGLSRFRSGHSVSCDRRPDAEGLMSSVENFVGPSKQIKRQIQFN
jgi:hypothetical protein